MSKSTSYKRHLVCKCGEKLFENHTIRDMDIDSDNVATLFVIEWLECPKCKKKYNVKTHVDYYPLDLEKDNIID